MPFKDKTEYNNYMRNYYQNHKKEINARRPKYHQHPRFPLQIRNWRNKVTHGIQVLKWKKKNPEKVKAERKATYHISLEGHCCSVCGSIVNLEKHHPDYSKPLEVVFLCAKHHPKRIKKVV